MKATNDSKIIKLNYMKKYIVISNKWVGKLNR